MPEKTCRICGHSRPASEDFCPVCTAPPARPPVRDRSASAVVDTGLVRRWGGGQENPTIEEMRAALAELDAPDDEHPDCWLSDENGWTIAAYQSGQVVLENPESNDGPWHMKEKSRDEVLKLWLLLQAGDLTAVRSMAWIGGYGGAA